MLAEYTPRGACASMFGARDPELLLAGPAGTGKSLVCLMKLNFLAQKYPGMRALMVRKTRESLTQSAMVTFERFVQVPGSCRFVSYRGEYRYGNGSALVTGGLDKTAKIMSTEYDVIYLNEATEATEDDWEHLLTRVRGTAMPYTQMLADCNPAGQNHWLLKRAKSGRLRIIDSRHEDNPLLYDGSEPTEFGRSYLAKLDSLTGVRRKRLLLGQWVTAEGVVYDEFDRDVHMRDRFKATSYGNPPKDWRRYWSVDFGYTHPFVWQAWAENPEDGSLYRFRELYHTGLLVEEAARLIRDWMVREHEEFPSAIVCDHDAEGRATLRAKLGVPTVAANKRVSLGIQAVKARLADPRMFFLRDSSLKVDATLQDAKRPTCTEDEFELYAWREGVKDSEPVKENDHGMDATRYLTMHVDGKRQWGGKSWGC